MKREDYENNAWVDEPTNRRKAREGYANNACMDETVNRRLQDAANAIRERGQEPPSGP